MDDISVQKRFAFWVAQWAVCPPDETIETNPPDLKDLANILRCLGYKVRRIDKGVQHEFTPVLQPKVMGVGSVGSVGGVGGHVKGSRVVLTCDISGTRIILEGSGGNCNCPTGEHDESTWNVSGSAPAGSLELLHKLETAGNSAIPPVPAAVKRVYSDVLLRVIHDLDELSKEERLSKEEDKEKAAAAAAAAAVNNPVRYRSLDTLTSPSAGGSNSLPNARPLASLNKKIEDMEIDQKPGELPAGKRPPPLVRQSTWTGARQDENFDRQFFAAQDNDHAQQHLELAAAEIQKALDVMRSSASPCASMLSLIDEPSATEPVTMDRSLKNSSRSSYRVTVSSPSLLGTQRTAVAAAAAAAAATTPGAAAAKASIPRRTLSNLSALMRQGKKSPISEKPEAAATVKPLGSRAHNLLLPGVSLKRLSTPVPAALARNPKMMSSEKIGAGRYQPDKGPGMTRTHSSMGNLAQRSPAVRSPISSLTSKFTAASSVAFSSAKASPLRARMFPGLTTTTGVGSLQKKARPEVTKRDENGTQKTGIAGLKKAGESSGLKKPMDVGLKKP